MEAMQFDISRPEQARWLAVMLAEFQQYGVRFAITKDSNLVFVEIK